LIVGSIAMAAVLMAAGGTANSSAASIEELPANTVAVVSHLPVSVGRITKAEFQRALVQGAAMDGRGPALKPGDRGYEALKNAVVEERLDSVWIQGQAAEMGISVTPRQVATELAQIKKQNFKNEAAYRRYLREAHFTQRDVNERVELQLLATQIQEKVLRKAKGKSQSGARKVFEEFVAGYTNRWRARTVCALDYLLDRCSNYSTAVRTGRSPALSGCWRSALAAVRRLTWPS
jgi:hypothetical protein